MAFRAVHSTPSERDYYDIYEDLQICTAETQRLRHLVEDAQDSTGEVAMLRAQVHELQEVNAEQRVELEQLVERIQEFQETLEEWQEYAAAMQNHYTQKRKRAPKMTAAQKLKEDAEHAKRVQEMRLEVGERQAARFTDIVDRYTKGFFAERGEAAPDTLVDPLAHLDELRPPPPIDVNRPRPKKRITPSLISTSTGAPLGSFSDGGGSSTDRM